MKSSFRLAKYSLYFIFVCAVSSAGMGLHGEARTIRVGIYNLRPLAEVEAEGHGFRGMAVEVLEEVARREGWILEFVPGSLNQILDKAREGGIDLVAAVSRSPERDALLDFTRIPFFVDTGNVYAKTDVVLTNMADLDGRQIACLKSSLLVPEFQAYCSRAGITVDMVLRNTYEEVFSAVDQGIAEACLSSELAGARFSTGHDVHKTHVNFASIFISFAVPKGKNPEILAALDMRMTELRAEPDSVYYGAYQRWVAMSLERPFPSWAFPLLLTGLTLMVAAAVFALVFRHQLRIKTHELEKMNKALESAQIYAKVGSWTWDIANNKLAWSKEMYRIFGVDQDVFSGMLPDIIKTRIHPDDQAKVEASNRMVSEQGIPQALEYRIILPEGSVRTVWAEAGKLEKDSSGRALRLSGYVQDISERKRQERKLEDAFHEREVLLKELYHRTKNNMFMISALLTLLADDAAHPDVREAFLDMVNRIHSMALVHQMLYKTQNLDWIDMAEYLPVLVRHTVRNLQKSDLEIRIQADLCHTRLGLDLAIPWGLVVNEIVMNACRYAFPTPPKGQSPLILMKLSETAEGYECMIRDNGVGLPPEFRPSHWGLGMQLMRTLMEEQLRGSMEFRSDHGMEFMLRIPKERKPRL